MYGLPLIEIGKISGTKFVDGAPLKNAGDGRNASVNRSVATTDHSLVRNVGYARARRAASAVILSLRNCRRLDIEPVMAPD